MTSPDDTAVTFESLGVCEALCEAVKLMGWNTPSSIQKESLPVAFQGSGKTGAFALPILQSLLKNGGRPPYALVLAPTRELAIQISQAFDALGSSIGAKSVSIVGGVGMVEQARALGLNPHIIVATPGRLVDHLKNTRGFSLRHIKFLVFDEADRLLNPEFEDDIDQLLRVLPKERTTYLYSATMTSKVAKLQRASLMDPVKVEVSSKYTTVSTLVQNYLFVPAKHKDAYLVFLCNEFCGQSMMIFTMTCSTTQRIAYMALGFDAIALHGQMSQPKRLSALNKFKAQDKTVLIATDVASRGLDIPSVDVVINYDMPTHSKDYIHRVGRTARAGRSGRSITIVTQYDVELFQRVEQLIDKKLDEYKCDKQAVMLMMERVIDAQRIATMQVREHEAKEKRKKRGPSGGDEDNEETEPAKKKK